MATSGSLTSTVKFGNYELILTQTSQDVTNNCSYWTATLNFTLQAYGKIVSSASKDITVTINGTSYTSTYKFGTVDNSNNSSVLTKTIYTKTGIKIPHNSDGSKTFNIAFSAEVAITYGGTYIGTTSKSGTITANTIARATTPTASATNVTLGNSITINTPRASDSFTHKLYYIVGGSAKTLIASDVGTSYAWTVPLTLANYITDGVTATITVYCATYNGSTLVGEKWVAFFGSVPTSVVPSVSAINVSEATSGLASAFGVYVKSKSTLKTTISASGSYGSTIKSYKTTIDGTTYTGSSFTSYPINTSGTITITTTVTDSRGRSASKSTTITVYDYFSPVISKFEVARCLSDGTLSDDGTYVKCTYTYSIATVNNKNTKTVYIQYLNGETWTTLTTLTAYSSTNGTYTSTVTFSANSAYSLRLYVKDHYTEAIVSKTLPTAFTLINYHNSGRGIAFGRVAQRDNAVEVGLNLYSYNGLELFHETPYIDFHYDNAPEDYTHRIIADTADRFLFTKNIAVAGKITSNGTEVELKKAQGVLWSGAYHMNSDRTITLSETISSQKNGIVLVWSYYDGEVKNHSWNTHFISKKEIELLSGNPHTFLMAINAGLSTFGAKYLYISDNQIAGHATNVASGTSDSGIKFSNDKYVLRYVIGV